MDSCKKLSTQEPLEQDGASYWRKQHRKMLRRLNRCMTQSTAMSAAAALLSGSPSVDDADCHASSICSNSRRSSKTSSIMRSLEDFVLDACAPPSGDLQALAKLLEGSSPMVSRQTSCSDMSLANESNFHEENLADDWTTPLDASDDLAMDRIPSDASERPGAWQQLLANASAPSAPKVSASTIGMIGFCLAVRFLCRMYANAPAAPPPETLAPAPPAGEDATGFRRAGSALPRLVFAATLSFIGGMGLSAVQPLDSAEFSVMFLAL